MSDIARRRWRGCIVWNVLGLSCTATDLWKEEINTERCVLVLEETLELSDLLPEHVWGVSNTADDPDAAGVGDCSGELGACGDVHAGQHDGVVDLQEIGGDGPDLLWQGGLVLGGCFHVIVMARGMAYGGRIVFGPWLRIVCLDQRWFRGNASEGWVG